MRVCRFEADRMGDGRGAADYPTDDRQQILAFDAEGTVASVDVGQHEFAWRLPGVLAGTAMAGFLFLLARILFRRRSIGVIVAIVALADGMFFVQSRIGMNDAYVGAAIVGAYTVFAALWTGVVAASRRVLDRDAPGRRPAGPGAGVEVGRSLRAGRDRPAHPGRGAPWAAS